jgi:hypothetical protein
MMTPTDEYTLAIPDDVERLLGRCRASIRKTIQARLDEIVIGAASSALSRGVGLHEPPLRFYVYEGYRISYQVDAASRRVVVLDLASDSV